MKIWKYIYTDEIVKIVQDDEEIVSIANADILPKVYCLLIYDFQNGICYVHSDVAIPGLVLFKENSARMVV
jgi:hypothetical protein